jgi:hypothetical protein
MKTKASLIYLLLVVIIVFENCTNKQKKNVTPVNDYFTIPILQLNNKCLFPIFDSVIASVQADSEAYPKVKYKNNMCFTLENENHSDTLGTLKTNDEFYIAEDGYADGTFMEWIYKTYFIGCVKYDKHLFFIHKYFRNTKWFAFTNQYEKLIKFDMTTNYFPTCDRHRDWLIKYNNGKFYFQD